MLFTKVLKGQAGWEGKVINILRVLFPHPNGSPAQNSLVATAALRVNEGFLEEDGSIPLYSSHPQEGREAWFRGRRVRACIRLRAACDHTLPRGEPAWVGGSRRWAQKPLHPLPAFGTGCAPSPPSHSPWEESLFATFFKNLNSYLCWMVLRNYYTHIKTPECSSIRYFSIKKKITGSPERISQSSLHNRRVFPCDSCVSERLPVDHR